MKCPVCNAWVTVLETRGVKTINGKYRRYECGNLHRFTTEERIKKVLSVERTNAGNSEETTAKKIL